MATRASALSAACLTEAIDHHHHYHLFSPAAASPSTLNAMFSLASLALLCASALPAFGLNITVYQGNTTIAPSPLPPPGASSQGEEVVRQFTQLSRSSKWTLVESVRFEGDTFEPEGLVRIGDDRYFVSAGEYTTPTQKYNQTINGTDRTAGVGFGHLIVFSGSGRRIADATLTQAGQIEYHNGGIDYDGTYIWATLAQYRPNTTATLVRIDPTTLEPEPLAHIADHQGGAIHDLSTGTVLTLNWGSRVASLFNLNYKFSTPPAFTTPQAVIKNPSQWVDWQDCKFLGHSQTYAFKPVMMCGGITSLYNTTIGGLAIIDMESMVPLYEVPLTMTSDDGNLVTKNPMDVAIVDGKMRLYFLPDERNSTLYVYEVSP